MIRANSTGNNNVGQAIAGAIIPGAYLFHPNFPPYPAHSKPQWIAPRKDRIYVEFDVFVRLVIFNLYIYKMYSHSPLHRSQLEWVQVGAEPVQLSVQREPDYHQLLRGSFHTRNRPSGKMWPHRESHRPIPEPEHP